MLVLVLPAGCGRLAIPAPECDPSSPPPSSASVSCDAAVDMALKALPDDHATLSRVQFVYGSATPSGCGAGLASGEQMGVCATVVFTFQDGDRQFVALHGRPGQLVASSPAPY